MVPMWILITAALIAGFIALLVLNGRKKEQVERERVQQKTQKKPPEPLKASPPPPKVEAKPKVRKNIIEEATYVDASEANETGDFYSEVAELFRQSLAEHPERQDLRAKLLDVYYDSGKKDAFVQEAEVFHSTMGSKQDPYWSRICEMGSSLAPDHALFGGKSRAEIEKVDKPRKQDVSGKKIRRFGDAENAKPALAALAESYKALRHSKDFFTQLDLELLRTAGRPAHMLHAKEMSRMNQGAQIFIKREDQNGKHPRLHTHLMGQACIAKRLGKKKVIFAAANGEEAVIAAQAGARLNLQTLIYISAEEGKYRESHKFQANLMGAEFIETLPGDESGDIRYAALDAWLLSHESSYMMLNLDAGPHPYPTIAADLQTVIGRECMRQVKGKLGKLPSAVFARAGGNADAIGFVEPFLAKRSVDIYLVSAELEDTYPDQGSTGSKDLYKLLYSNKQKQSANNLLEDFEFQRVDREHALLKATGRMQYVDVDTNAAKEAIKKMARLEGVIFPMDTAHVLAKACEVARKLGSDEAVVLMLSERLEKDLLSVSNEFF